MTTFGNGDDRFTTTELIELSREVSFEWEIFAVLLGFSRYQIQTLKDSTQGIASRTFRLIYSWYDAVKHCDENCRHLAKAFMGIGDNLTASIIVGGDGSLLSEIRNMEMRPATEEKVLEIKF